MRAWDHLLNAKDRALLEKAKFGRRIGIGEKPVVLVIDVQNYMVGSPGGSSSSGYPSACPTARDAVQPLKSLLEAARQNRIPIVYTQFVLRPDGGDMGVYRRKRDLLNIEGWCLEGTTGAEILQDVAPQPSDYVFVKKKPSAFLGTPLLGLLIDKGVDTVIVTGGSTSNCVRATAVDSTSYNFRTIVAEDCVFDRFEVSHFVALFDLDRQYADVMPSAEVIGQLPTLVANR